MTHETEKEFAEAIAADLADLYGEDRVETEKVLPVSDRRVDIYVQTTSGAEDLAIEVENDSESIAEGVGQVTLYAEQLDARPVVFVPMGHIEVPEVFYFAAQGVDIYQYPTEGV